MRLRDFCVIALCFVVLSRDKRNEVPAAMV